MFVSPSQWLFIQQSRCSDFLLTLKGPIHSKINCVKKKNNNRKTELNVLWHSTVFPSGLSVFLSILCVFLCVWLWWIKTKNDLYTSISARVASLLFILEGWVTWDKAIVVSAGKLRKLRDSLSELRSSLCERRLESTVLRPALLPVKTAQFT